MEPVISRKIRKDKINDLKARIADLKSRFPAHSLKPAMMQELEELEEELSRLEREEYHGT